MRKLKYSTPNNLSQLHDELIAAIPSFRPAPDPVIVVEGMGDQILLTVPNNSDQSAVAAVVAAHSPKPLQEDSTEFDRARITAILDIPRSSWTAAQQKELLELVARDHTR